jgi:hypothetical protein
MWPKLRGQAGPAPDAGDQEPEPEPDPQLELISVPDSDDSNVKHPGCHFPTFNSLIFRSFRIPFTICYNMSLK